MILKIILIVLACVAATLILINNRVPANLGVMNGRLSPLPATPNCVSSQTDRGSKMVEPLQFRGNLQESREAILAALASMGNIRILRSERTYLHAVHTTPVMRFHDDLEFSFDEAARRIHFRSASRTGYYDFGVNRRRYEQLSGLYRNAETPEE